MARSNLVAYAFEWGTRSSMILKLGTDHQGLKVYLVYIEVQDNEPWFDLDLFHSKVKFGQICLLCLYQTNSQVSVYRTIGLMVQIVSKRDCNLNI